MTFKKFTTQTIRHRDQRINVRVTGVANLVGGVFFALAVVGALVMQAADLASWVIGLYLTSTTFSTPLQFPAMALERIQKEKPDVILTDLNMPDITGIDLARGVRQNYSKEDLPIIMVTTQDEARDNEAAYSAGVNGILQKPFSEGQIGKALERFAGMQPFS